MGFLNRLPRRFEDDAASAALAFADARKAASEPPRDSASAALPVASEVPVRAASVGPSATGEDSMTIVVQSASEPPTPTPVRATAATTASAPAAAPAPATPLAALATVPDRRRTFQDLRTLVDEGAALPIACTEQLSTLRALMEDVQAWLNRGMAHLA